MSHDARKRGPTISTVTAETLANRLVNDEFRNAPPGPWLTAALAARPGIGGG